MIENHCLAGVVPVIPSLAEDQEQEPPVNVNADTAAAAVAQAIKADKLVFLTDTPGILLNKDEPGSLDTGSDSRRVPRLDRSWGHRLGMIPKVEARLTSLDAGVLKTHIIDGRLPMRCSWRSSRTLGSAPRSSIPRTLSSRPHGPPPGDGTSLRRAADQARP